MYDRKTVRRRRAVLGLLVAGALILLTAYFGESSSGGLHSVQRGVFSIVSPIQDVASRVLKPFKDTINWVGDTVDAKSEVGDLRTERDKYRRQAAAYATALSNRFGKQALQQADDALGLSQYGPVDASVFGFSPSVWSQQVSIDVGSGDGVRPEQPVVNASGLVGLTDQVVGGASIVGLITNGQLKIGVTIQSASGGGDIVTGLAQASVGQPNDLVVTGPSNHRLVRVGDFVVTSGTMPDPRALRSLYPPGLTVGTVTRVDDAQTDGQQVHVRPAADVRDLRDVQVLTKVGRGTR